MPHSLSFNPGGEHRDGSVSVVSKVQSGPGRLEFSNFVLRNPFFLFFSYFLSIIIV